MDSPDVDIVAMRQTTVKLWLEMAAFEFLTAIPSMGR